jgi:hypothetical protein
MTWFRPGFAGPFLLQHSIFHFVFLPIFPLRRSISQHPVLFANERSRYRATSHPRNAACLTQAIALAAQCAHRAIARASFRAPVRRKLHVVFEHEIDRIENHLDG